MKKFSTKELVYLALLISLNIVLTRIASIRLTIGGVEGIRIGFGGFPTILAGIIFGPVSGGIVGAIGDIVGYSINPAGPYMPHFTLTAALTGIIPALVIMPFKKGIPGFWLLLFAIATGEIITSAILVPYFLQMLFNIPMLVSLPAKIISLVIQIPIYAFFGELILKRINFILNLNPR